MKNTCRRTWRRNNSISRAKMPGKKSSANAWSTSGRIGKTTKNLKKQHPYKPGSVSAAADSCHFSKRPTPRQKRVAFFTPVYMAFQPAGQTAKTVTRLPGGLLPHLLTLTPPGRSGCFLLCYRALTNACLSTVRHPLLPGLSSAISALADLTATGPDAAV